MNERLTARLKIADNNKAGTQTKKNNFFSIFFWAAPSSADNNKAGTQILMATIAVTNPWTLIKQEC